MPIDLILVASMQVVRIFDGQNLFHLIHGPPSSDSSSMFPDKVCISCEDDSIAKCCQELAGGCLGCQCDVLEPLSLSGNDFYLCVCRAFVCGVV